MYIVERVCAEQKRWHTVVSHNYHCCKIHSVGTKIGPLIYFLNLLN